MTRLQPTTLLKKINSFAVIFQEFFPVFKEHLLQGTMTASVQRANVLVLTMRIGICVFFFVGAKMKYHLLSF